VRAWPSGKRVGLRNQESVGTNPSDAGWKSRDKSGRGSGAEGRGEQKSEMKHEGGAAEEGPRRSARGGGIEAEEARLVRTSDCDLFLFCFVF